ncbi:hypothetical protein HARCEL1_03595 [Halococcoides cellulosivorans]|uniref:Uncharacterized protein n=1 Tax=Halococcoides cellulosivorans TaxID=1679096 RepID=A0A2R4WZ93_9EURY|nr:hypothetical protein HARCEL1_03595 [Halococcoides cellulosivorans]
MTGRGPPTLRRVLGNVAVGCFCLGLLGLLLLPTVHVRPAHTLLGVLGFANSVDVVRALTAVAWLVGFALAALLRRTEPDR